MLCGLAKLTDAQAGLLVLLASPIGDEPIRDLRREPHLKRFATFGATALPNIQINLFAVLSYIRFRTNDFVRLPLEYSLHHVASVWPTLAPWARIRYVHCAELPLPSC
jgi:hypothetical protein